jgi:hypothetical protein
MRCDHTEGEDWEEGEEWRGMDEEEEGLEGGKAQERRGRGSQGSTAVVEKNNG